MRSPMRLLEKEVLDGSEVAEMVKAYQEGRPFPASTPAPSGGPTKPGQVLAPEKPKPAGEESSGDTGTSAQARSRVSR